MWLKDEHGRYLECNAAAVEVIRAPRERIVGRTDAEVHSNPDIVAAIRKIDQEVARTGTAQRLEIQYNRTASDVHDLEIIKVPIRAPDGGLVGVLGVGRDITERKRAERELQLAAVAFESQDGMIVTDASGRIERINSAFTRMTGYADEEIAGE